MISLLVGFVVGTLGMRFVLLGSWRLGGAGGKKLLVGLCLPMGTVDRKTRETISRRTFRVSSALGPAQS